MKNIIIFEKDSQRMKLSFETFMNMLDTNLRLSWITKNFAKLETNTYNIRFYVVQEEEFKTDFLRGLRPNLIFNNTMNKSIEEFVYTL